MLENRIEDLHKTLRKFSKGRNNLDIYLGNQKAMYNEVGLEYQPEYNAKSFSKFRHANNIYVTCLNIFIVVKMVILLLIML